jgi:hypothetical protein
VNRYLSIGLLVLILIAACSCATTHTNPDGEVITTVVTARVYTPASTSIMPIGKGSPMTINHPAKWKISVRVDEQEITIFTTKAAYDTIAVGNKVDVTWYRGELILLTHTK